MKIRLAVPPAYTPEGDRVVRALRELGVDAEFAGPGRQAEVRIVPAEEFGRMPGPDGTAVVPLPEPRDALVTRDGRPGWLAELEVAARVGVAGRLRAEMLRVLRPDLTPVALGDVAEVRGQLEAGTLDAWIAPVREVRAAGLADWIGEVLEPTSWATGAGRGALVIDASRAESSVRESVAKLDDPASRAALSSEWTTLEELGEGPESTLGVLARPHGRQLRVRAMVAAADGRRLVRAEVSGPLSDPVGAGRRTAEILRGRGAGELLGSAP